MSLSATMTFTKNATVLTLPAPDAGSVARRPILAQAIAHSASGGLFVDDKNVARYEVAFSCSLTSAQAALFDTFYRSTAVGALNAFTWLDHEGKSFSDCRFSDDKPDLVRQQDGRYRLSLTLITPSLFGS